MKRPFFEMDALARLINRPDDGVGQGNGMGPGNPDGPSFGRMQGWGTPGVPGRELVARHAR